MSKPTEVKELTPRELEVLGFVAQSLTNREIAAKLKITHHTIKAHVSVIIHKLNAKNRMDAVMRAYQLGLINPPQD